MMMMMKKQASLEMPLRPQQQRVKEVPEQTINPLQNILPDLEFQKRKIIILMMKMTTRNLI